MELTQALKKAYENPTEHNDPELERAAMLYKMQATEFTPKITSDTYRLPEEINLQVRYDKKCICIHTRENSVALSFSSFMNLVSFFDWLRNNKEL